MNDETKEDQNNVVFPNLSLPDLDYYFYEYVIPDISFHWEEFSMSLYDVEIPDICQSWDND